MTTAGIRRVGVVDFFETGLGAERRGTARMECFT
jgi:hypothetical protein